MMEKDSKAKPSEKQTFEELGSKSLPPIKQKIDPPRMKPPKKS